MSFYTNNLEPTLDTFDVYNSNIQNVEIYHDSSDYANDINTLLQKTYNDNLKNVCDIILNHFNNVNNNINTETYKEPLIININFLNSEDVTNLLLSLTNKGYTPLVIVQNGESKLQI